MKLLLVITVLPLGWLSAAEPGAVDYNSQVAPLFKKYCNGCHNAEDAEGELVLDNFTKLTRGGENGAVIVPGKPDKSRLILALEKKIEPFMPPEDNKAPTAKEIALLKAWITAGAKGPDGKQPDPTVLVTPKISPVGTVRKPVHAVAYSPDGKLFAVARYGRVEIRSAADGKDGKVVRTLSGHNGHVNDVGFSSDGKLLFAAAGEPGLYGELSLWTTADWKRIRTIKGHRDSLYAAGISPDGKMLATGSYDQKIKLWDAGTGKELRELTGHNGAVFDLAFHPGGKILASASGDRTVKLWNVATGERLDTFGQPEKGQYAVAISPDGRYVAAGGRDNRIRVWEIRQMGREGTNPLLYSRFAHEGPILKLVFSPDGQVLVSSAEDRAVKFWETKQFTQRRALKQQSDWATALAISPGSETLLIGRLDGSVSAFSLQGSLGDGQAVPTPVNGVVVSSHRGELSSAKLPEISESEPNDLFAAATALPAPGIARGVLMPAHGSSQDVDLFRFESKKGQVWIIETMAGRNKSSADTKIEVLHTNGKPVLRYLLRAVRDSYITFRPIDSTQSQARVKNWEEMELNEYMYMAGEVCKLFRMPQGPDSGFLFYTRNGKRRCYFDTSATVHARDDPIYIVQPYLPGTKLADNGLPVFSLYYSNDDDGERKLGNDSKLTFQAPADGPYLIRVTDVRGFGGKKYRYQLTVREPKPDFTVTLAGKGATIGAGSGQRLTVNLNRTDNFDGEVRIDITGMPAGFRVTSPIVVQAGHVTAQGVLNADVDAKAPSKEVWSQVKAVATAEIDGKEISKQLGNLGEIKLGDKPKVRVILEPDGLGKSASSDSKQSELVIVPGTTMTAMLRIERNGFDGELKFDVDNLPHGVIVDNIGLSGVLVRKGENSRQIFLTAAQWVPETTRSIHAVAKGQGNQASLPIVLHVRKSGQIVRRD